MNDKSVSAEERRAPDGGTESLFQDIPPPGLRRLPFRCRMGWHTPTWSAEHGYGNDTRCKRCGIPMWANYASYGIDFKRARVEGWS